MNATFARLASLPLFQVCLAGTPEASGAASLDPAAYNGFDVSAATIPLSAIERGGPPKGGIPAIDRPKFVTAAESPLHADDRVLALKHNGIARAYPVRILNWHGVVNDRVGSD
ncbi:MAG: DUF3179 domain-containing (seleno)protein, partial [Betaproteobacteria bacterium]